MEPVVCKSRPASLVRSVKKPSVKKLPEPALNSVLCWVGIIMSTKNLDEIRCLCWCQWEDPRAHSDRPMTHGFKLHKVQSVLWLASPELRLNRKSFTLELQWLPV